jgi:hypothetical protein
MIIYNRENKNSYCISSYGHNIYLWSATEKGGKAILHGNYLYRLRRENQYGSLVYVRTFKWCSHTITLKDNLIIKSNGVNHNHDLILSENVQTVFYGLKQRVLTDIDQPITTIYEEVKKFVNVCSFHLISI